MAWGAILVLQAFFLYRNVEKYLFMSINSCIFVETI